MHNHAHLTHPSVAASSHGAASLTLELLEARQLRDALKTLLRTELSAMADFLVALADFDRRRGWEALGHASLFAFLHVELRLSNSAAFYRKSAAQLLQRFPQLIEPLGDGRLCLSTTFELAKVLTEENGAEVAPRFFGLSAREAQELVAELQPRQVPATRMVVTRLEPLSAPSRSEASEAQSLLSLAPAQPSHPYVVPPTQLLTSEVANGGGGRPAAPRDDVEPLTADLRRLHITVSRQFLRELETAKDGLSHAIPNATTEQVLQAALRLLLEKQAKARGQVKKPRTVLAAAAPRAEAPVEARTEPQEASPPLALLPTEPPPTDPPTTEPRPARRTGPREAIPAAVRRAVWARDDGRCSWPLDAGGSCRSTNRLELDHIVPWADWGPSTVENLRVVCHLHNYLAARQAFGERQMNRYVDGAG